MTLMHISSRAPELSAATRRVLSWIIVLLSRCSFRRRAFDHAHQRPRLVPRQRPAFRDGDRIALAAFVLLVVRQQLGRAPDVFAVGRVLDQTLDLDRDGLVHLVADDGAGQRARCVAHFAFLCSFCTVFSRAILPRTFACWSGRDGCPLAAAMRRLNCSRRNATSSSVRAARSLPRRSFRKRPRSLMFFLLISAPSASRRPSPPTTWRPPAGMPRAPSLPARPRSRTGPCRAAPWRPSTRRCPCRCPCAPRAASG